MTSLTKPESQDQDTFNYSLKLSAKDQNGRFRDNIQDI